MSEALDPRLHAFRADLADERLRGKVNAERFVTPTKMRVIAPFADILREPDERSGLDTQALHGDGISVFETRGDWCWVQCDRDGYTGYAKADAFGGSGPAVTHMVLAPRTFRYSKPDLKSARTGYLSMGSSVCVVDEVTTRGTDYLVLDRGDALIAGHLMPNGQWQDDPVAVAQTLLHSPYLWGGATGFGLDCSGLISLAQRLCGRTVLRDTSMQCASIGDPIDPGADFDALQRGDLVFWNGHVGMMSDSENLLHANGHSMNVALEPLHGAIARIGYLYGQPTIVRRP